MVKMMLTQGEARVLQSQGHSLAVNLAHPQNRRALRSEYKRMPRRIRRNIFGRWLRTRCQFPAWELA